MNLLLSLRSELYKTRRTAAFYFTFIGAALIPFMFLLNALTDGLPDEGDSTGDPLNAIFMLSAQMNAMAIFPWFVILICTLLPQIEFRNNTWKSVLTSPQRKVNVYAARFLVVQLLMITFLVFNHLLMWLVAVAIHFILPDLNILNQPLNLQEVLRIVGNSYLTVLAISAVQFWIGLRSKNFLLPIGIGFVCWLAGTVMAMEYQSDYSYYFPYSFHTFNMSGLFKPHIASAVTTSALYAAVMLLLGFLDFRRRRMV